MANRIASEGEPFAADPPDGPPVRGFLHRSAKRSDGWVLTHGAGGNCGASLLVSVAACFAEAGTTVLRCDLPFRQERRQGPPRPAGAANDREGLRTAVAALRKIVAGRVFLGGQSYGGRQATMLSAARADATDGLILLSYPLHPPNAPAKKRTEHLPQIRVPALFVHGTRDPFGLPEEMEEALKLIPGKVGLVLIDGAGHGLTGAKSAGLSADAVAARILSEVEAFFGTRKKQGFEAGD